MIINKQKTMDQNLDDTTCDVRLEFVVENAQARTLAEDIISYCQLQLIELAPKTEI